jgi:hypothetical protein
MRRIFFAAMVLGATSAFCDCDFKTIREKTFEALQAIEPEVGGKAAYRQVLEFPNGAVEPLPWQSDYETREIPVALADLERCVVGVVMERRKIRNGKLSPPLGDHVRLSERAFLKPIWNDFNTNSVSCDPHLLVTGIRWRFFSRAGSVSYVPYSYDLARIFPELEEEGKRHFSADMDEALAELLRRKLLDAEFERKVHDLLPVIFGSESIDPFEFKAATAEMRQLIMNQPFVTLGANGDNAYVLKVSFANAKGPMQIWDRSCDDIRKAYPQAELARDCVAASWGSHSHVGNIAAAALEIQMHEKVLIHFLGKRTLKRKDYPKMLEASYNGGPGHVIKAFRKYGGDWQKAHFVVRRVGKGKHRTKVRELSPNSLRAETVDYLSKCVALQNSVRPKPSAG